MRIKHWFYTAPLRLRSLFRRAQVERELDEELRYHIERQIEEHISKGMTEEEARYTALRAMGGVERRKEECRDTRRVRWVEDLMQDVRYSLRMLRKNPGFTAVAVITLALGIGANTAIFSLLDAVLLKMLPVERPEQLYLIQNVGPRNLNAGAPPYPCFEQFRERARSFTGLAAFTTHSPKLRIDGQLEEVSGQFVSGNYFSLLGVRAALGRTLGPADDAAPGRGGPDGLVAVISYNYWSRRFGRDPAV